MQDKTSESLRVYNAIAERRRIAISNNRSIRMSNIQNGTFIPLVSVPERPELPKRRIAFEPDGTYYGALHDDDDAPEGYVVKLVNATW